MLMPETTIDEDGPALAAVAEIGGTRKRSDVAAITYTDPTQGDRNEIFGSCPGLSDARHMRAAIEGVLLRRLGRAQVACRYD